MGDTNLGELPVKDDGTVESRNEIADAVSAGVARIQEEADSAIAKIQSAAQAAQSKTTESKATSSAASTVRKIEIDKSVNTKQGDVKFYRIDVDSEKLTIVFRCTLPDPAMLITESYKNPAVGIDLYPTIKDRAGKELPFVEFANEWDILPLSSGVAVKYTAENDISQVTITFAMDDYPNDPITVTLDIPLE